MIKIRLGEGGEIPKYKTELASGMDVKIVSILGAYKGAKPVEGAKLQGIKDSFKTRGYLKMRPFERILFGTGISISDMREDLELQIRPRSGVSLKRGLIVVPGTIDADYRGEIGVILVNSTPYLNTVQLKENIAQVIISNVVRSEIGISDVVSITTRGSGGFGSTNF